MSNLYRSSVQEQLVYVATFHKRLNPFVPSCDTSFVLIACPSVMFKIGNFLRTSPRILKGIVLRTSPRARGSF